MANLLITTFGLTLLLASMTGRLGKFVTILSMQGFLLFALVIVNAGRLDTGSIVFLSIETFGFKALILPYFLNYTIRRNDITREMQANVPNFFSVIICSIFLVLGFYMSYLAKNIGHPIGALYFGISVATILTSLFLILARKQLITHVMGYLMLENGIFLLSFAIAHEMPLLINLGVLLDLFLGILLLGVFMSHIRTTFDDTDVDQLTNLKD